MSFCGFRAARVAFVFVSLTMGKACVPWLYGVQALDGELHIESALVLVPVVVRDDRGRFVRGLPPSSFKLFEDGLQVPITHFFTSEDPIRVALLLDTSRSTTTILGKIKKSAVRFLRQMRPEDLAMVASFDSTFQVLCPFSSDLSELKKGIGRARAGGAYTRMRDAIYETIGPRFRTVGGRKAVILLTDGRDQGSRVSPNELLQAVAASNAPIYSIFFSVDPKQLMRELLGVQTRRGGEDPSWRHEEMAAAACLENISNQSAGRFYNSKIDDLDRVFGQITEELRSQYLLGYYPEKSKLNGSVHSLVVSVAAPNVIVRNRPSYRAAR